MQDRSKQGLSVSNAVKGHISPPSNDLPKLQGKTKGLGLSKNVGIFVKFCF